MSLNNSTNLYTNTKYVVSSAGNTPYTTIQSAINAAAAAGIPATVYIRPGTYTENLTLSSYIFLEGNESTEVTINGQHTPPTTGVLAFTRITFGASGIGGINDIIKDTSNAGSTKIKFTRCNFTVFGGRICNLTNWTGAITFKYCDESGSTNNGVVYNTGSSIVTIKNCELGNGTVYSLTSAGTLLFNNADIGCPIALSGSSASVIQGGSTLRGTVTVSSNADLQISNSRMPTGSTPCLSTTSSVAVKCSNVVMDTSNTYAVTTTGTGTYKPNEVTFSNSKGINASITETLTGVVKTGEIYADTITRMVMSGFYSWAASGPYFDDTTLGTFSLLVGGTGYIKSRLVTWSGGQNVTGMTAGNTYYIYIDSTGTIGSTTSHTDAMYENYILLFECLRDSTPITNNQFTVAENHPYSFQTAPSNYLHDVVGPVIQNVNNGANIVLSGTQKIGISGDDVLSDHGLDTQITATATVSSWLKYYTTAGGKWARQNATDSFTGYWNNGGTPTALTAGYFAVYTLYVTKQNLNTTTPNYIAVLDTSQYNTQAAASTAIANGTTAKATNELANLEMAQLGYIIYRESTATITVVTISKSTLKATLSTGGTNTAALVTTNTAAFNGMLSAADTNVQAALDTIDNWGAGATPNYGIMIAKGVGVAPAATAQGNSGTLLTAQGAANPIWTTATYPATIGIGEVLHGSAANVVSGLAAGTTGKILRAVTSAAPAWTTSTFADTYAIGTILHASAANTVTGLTAGATGEILTGATGAAPAWSSSPNITGTTTSATLRTGDPASVASIMSLNAATITMNGTGANVGLTVTPKGSATGLTVSAGGITATAGAITATSGNVVITAGNLTLPNTSSATGTTGVITFGGNKYISNYGARNVFIGEGSCGAGTATSGQADNTAVGYGTITQPNNNTCCKHTAVGSGALALVFGGYVEDTAVGYQALNTGGGGSYNTAIGSRAGRAVDSSTYNVHLGYSAGVLTTSGSNNTFIGASTASANTTGSDNTCVGYSAGSSMVAASASNIYIKNVGASESNKIRIGTTGSGAGQQNDVWIAGTYSPTTAIGGTASVMLVDSNDHIGGLAGSANTVFVGGTAPSFTANPTVTTIYATTFDTNVAAAKLQMSGTTIAAAGSNTDIDVTITPKGAGTILSTAVYSKAVGGTNRAMLVDNTGLIGNATSSLKFKENIVDMGDYSNPIMALRPVAFNYKADADKRLKLGLIAEEVAEIMPSLVSFDEDGAPYTVSYHELPAILLNEIQKLNRRVNELEAKLNKGV